MNRSRLLFAVLILTLPAMYQSASVSKAPSDESDAVKAFEAQDDRGAVFLYRTGRAVGAATATQIKVNGIDAGGTGPGTFFRWELKPGKYTFLASTGESSATIALDVEAGKLYFIYQTVRIGLNESRVSMKVQDEATGKKDVKVLQLLVSAYVPE